FSESSPANRASNTDVCIALLRSDIVTDGLIDRFSLITTFKETRPEVRARLQSETEISVGREGTLNISVQERDPQRAVDLANAYVDELEKLTTTVFATEAARRRLFFEGELKKASEELSNSQSALRETEEGSQDYVTKLREVKYREALFDI